MKSTRQSYSVIGVYTSGDAECIGERFCDHVMARSPKDAEALVRRKRTTDSILIAAVLHGHVQCAA